MIYHIRRISKDNGSWEFTGVANSPLEFAIDFAKLKKLKRGVRLVVMDNKAIFPNSFLFTISNSTPYKIEKGIINIEENNESEKENQVKEHIICSHCNKEVDSKFTYCNHCGKEIIKPKVCEQCKIIIDWDAKFCPQCGSTLAIMEN